MATTDNHSKTPMISKKWLYGSLAVIALALGLFLDKDAVAAESNPIDNSVEQVKIDNENGDVEIDTDIENNDFENDDLESDSFESDSFESYEDDFTEDDMED